MNPAERSSGERQPPESIYDRPEYYDLAFSPDSQIEVDFLAAAARKHALRSVRSVLECACGTGRLLVRMAAAGFFAHGIDLNPRAVEYCRARLTRRRLAGSASVADMVDFTLPKPVDLAYNMINSVRHLMTEDSARSHFQAVARNVHPGGLYVVGLHLTLSHGASSTDEESWTARRGKLAIDTYLWTVSKDPKTRQERLGLRFEIATPSRSFELHDEICLRTYTLAELRALLAKVSKLWELVETYDFHYEIDEPRALGPKTEDAVLILRRRS